MSRFGWRSRTELAWLFLRRELRGRYFGTWAGSLWVIISPLLLLLVYSAVFAGILKPHVAVQTETLMSWIAAALWPWLAFAEALTRAPGVVYDQRALLGKVAVPAEIYPIVAVSASFAAHGIGYVTVLLVLGIFFDAVNLTGVPFALCLFVVMYFFALGLGLAISALAVFVRDVGMLVGQVTTLWFFLTPIIYPKDSLVGSLREYIGLNPLTPIVEGFRWALLGERAPQGTSILMVCTLIVLVFAFGLWFYRRSAPRFDEFL